MVGVDAFNRKRYYDSEALHMKQVYGIWLPEDDTHFEKVMNSDGSYQKDTFDYAISYMKNPRIFYDIGAHVGLWSLMAHKAGFKEIYAFEPNPITLACLEKNVGNKAKIYNRAVSATASNADLIEEDVGNSGAVKLTYGSGNLIASRIGYKAEASITPHECLIKIDTEGNEADCVDGMREIIYALRPVVCVEQKTNKDALDILQRMGMRIVNQVRRDYILIWKNQ